MKILKTANLVFTTVCGCFHNKLTDLRYKLALAHTRTSLVGSNQDQVEATLSDRELLNQFQRVEQLSQDKKAIVKELLESFLLKCDLQKRMA